MEPNVAGEVNCVGTSLENVAKDHVVNISGGNIRSLHGRDPGENAKLSGGETLEGAAESAKRSSRTC